MTFEDLLRSTLRLQWNLAPARVVPLDRGVAARAWTVGTGTGDFVVQLVDPADRGAMEAGLSAVEHLRDRAVAAGAPVRTRAGALTATNTAGAWAVLHQPPGRRLVGGDPVDQQWWGDLLGRAHRELDGFAPAGLRRWHWLRAEAAHLALEPWMRPAVSEAVGLMTRLSVTDRLTYGVLHGDPAPAGFVVDIDTGRTALAGWGPATSGPLVYDLASAVVYAGGVDAAGDLIDGYTAAGPVSPPEVDAALPVLLRFRLAVLADGFARRIAAEGTAAAEDLAGLHRVRDALAACATGDGG